MECSAHLSRRGAARFTKCLSDKMHEALDACWMQLCTNCPDFLYDLDKLKHTWLSSCKDNGPSCENKAKQYLKTKFPHFRKDLTFVVAYDSEDTLCLFVDHKIYQTFKGKFEREIGDTLPDVLPSRLSGKCVPRTLQRFSSIKEFALFNEVRRQKNRDISRQKRANRLHDLERLEDALSEGNPSFLAFDLKVDRHDATKLRELGFVSFVFRPEDPEEGSFQTEYFIISRSKEPRKNHETNQDFCFGESNVATLDETLARFREQASVNFLITARADDARPLLQLAGLSGRAADLVDVPSLFHAAFPEHQGGASFAEILHALHVEFRLDWLGNAGNGATYVMNAFRALLRGELQCAADLEE